MESESLHEPATLLLFELNIELKASTGGESRVRAGQLSNTTLNCGELGNLLVRALHSSAINLPREIYPKLSSQSVRLFHEHLR